MYPIRFSPLPDELAGGYMGRILRINGPSSDRGHALKRIREFARAVAPNDLRATAVENLATIAGFETPVFVREHTTLPYQRTFAYQDNQVALMHGSPANRPLLRASALRPARPGIYLCAACVREDIKFHGISYWRRTHQLPGLFWCPKHERPLHWVDRDLCTALSPAGALAMASEIDPTWVAKLQRNPIIARFIAISVELSGLACPYDERDLSKWLREQATQWAADRARVAPVHVLLREHVRSHIDRRWLAALLPDFARNGPLPAGKKDIFERALSGKRSCSGTGLLTVILSVLFDSADTALLSMNAALAPSQSQAQLESGAAARLTNRQLRSAYIEARGNQYLAAKRLRVSPDIANQQLLHIGLPGLGGPHRRSVTCAINAFFIDGLSVAQAAASAGMEQAALEAFLRETSPLKPMLHAIQQKDKSRRRESTVPEVAAPPIRKPTEDQPATSMP